MPAGGEVVLSGYDSLLIRTPPENSSLPTSIVFSISAFGKRMSSTPPIFLVKNSCQATSQIARQAYAGLLMSKQFYHFIIKDWLDGDPTEPPPPAERKLGRNHEWPNLYNRDIISMPDKWEYPWYAAWDLAFHMLPMARVDSEFAKSQLLLFFANGTCIPTARCQPMNLHSVM